MLKLTAYSFDDADLISLPDSLAQQSPFLTSVNGIAFAQTLDGYFAVASTYNVDDALQQLPVLSEDFQYNFAMYDLNPELPLSFFKAFAPDFAPRYVGVYQRNLIFTPTRELLISVVNDMQRGNTLSYNKAYQQLTQHSASNVTLSRIANLYDQSSFSLQYPYIAEHITAGHYFSKPLRTITTCWTLYASISQKAILLTRCESVFTLHLTTRWLYRLLCC